MSLSIHANNTSGLQLRSRPQPTPKSTAYSSVLTPSETFMHMVESRSKSVINDLTNTLGLQLIFIMPTSKAGPFLLDLISKATSPAKVGELNT